MAPAIQEQNYFQIKDEDVTLIIHLYKRIQTFRGGLTLAIEIT